jgi:tetratricopeptide (TPR) repeat protein
MALYRRIAVAAALSFVVWARGTGAAQVAELVLGGGYAQDCHDAAERAADGLSVAQEAASACDLALGLQHLSRSDRAATLVNRGIVFLAKRDFATARRDFDAAVDAQPGLAGAYANRGAALIGMGRPADGILDIDRGLALGSPEPEKAYFNRGLAHESLGDLKAAYFDYRKALQIRPDWAPPTREFARFTVTARN